MKSIKVLYSLFILTLMSTLLYYGCSEVRDNVVVNTPSGLGPHPVGWTDVGHQNFHGTYIANSKWNLDQCKVCHGANYQGGSSGASCLKCHNLSVNGPEDCRTCHGNPEHAYPPSGLFNRTDPAYLGVGAHDKHLNPDSTVRFSRKVECGECHIPVNSYKDSSHIGPNPNNRGDIVFGPLAKNRLPGDPNTPNPTYDTATGKCSNVYCHGNFLQGNRNAAPVFNNPSTVKCGTCHGDPATGNPCPNGLGYPHYGLNFWSIQQCTNCHTEVIDANGIIRNKTLHVNGQVDRNGGL